MLELAAASILLGEDDENQDEIEELGWY
jgi:hypothetical protein